MTINLFRPRQMANIVTNAAIAALLILLNGCFYMKLDTREYRFDSMEHQKTLAIFLPGRGGSMMDLEQEGILENIRKSKIPIDIISVDAGLWFYVSRTLLQRLEADVIPMVRKGQYRNIWLIGNSMGGLGSLLYARENVSKIRGIILVGPFLGDKPIIEEIRGAGGLLRWTPKDAITENYQRDIWIYLKACAQDQAGIYPRLFLLAGKDDRFHVSHQLLASALKDQHVFWSEGGHDWSAWRSAFRDFLEQEFIDGSQGNTLKY